MFSKVRTTLKDSIIYGFGNITTKIVGLVLLPLYTSHITVSDYGILGILEITILILTQVLMFGQHQAYVRFFCKQDNTENTKDPFFTSFLFLILIGLLLNFFGNIFLKNISGKFHDPQVFKIYVQISLWVVAFRLINKLCLSSFRARGKALLYTISNICKLTCTLGLTIYFVAFMKIGIKGILISYLIGEVLLFIIILPRILTSIKFELDPLMLKKTLYFGFPLIFSALAGMLLNMGDRYILKILGNYKEVGLYNLGYKVASVLSIFLIQSFQLGLQPIAYSMYQKKGDKRFYSKMLTYSMFVLTWAGLGLAIISKELIKTLALNPDYWLAYTIVPYIIFGLLFSGARTVVNIGLYITHKTSSIAINTVIAAILNILLNFLLIPKFQILGAAYATIISFIVLYIMSYRAAQKHYKVPYENNKLFLLILLWIALVFLSSLTNGFSIVIRILIKISVFISFPFILYLLRFFEPVEIRRIGGSINKWMSKIRHKQVNKDYHG
ncbi:MAG: polysaccharide biosynthesis C-terminal domain-containing protein [Candidatus Cloacimonetes bacterium]|nr:polysaccharide biosynthesis C-terminal domain-containing protein [Candidatus Cloacimonadota bacterium]